MGFTDIITDLDKNISTRLSTARRNSSKLNVDHTFDFSTKTLRISVINDYKNNINFDQVSESTDIAKIVSSTNRPYSGRKDGLYYADDYVRLKHSSDSWIGLCGLTNNKYWNIATSDSFFKINEGVSPSDAIRAFFIGPTFPDCANVIQAATYLSILNKVGDEKFNQLFGNSITQFVITKWLYQSFSSTSKENPYGNPLYFLFDRFTPEDITLNYLKDGDILYIQGVSDYFHKHLCGFAPGWNLVCVRPDPKLEPRFVGFGPDTFGHSTLSFDELRIILIEFYNLDQSKETVDKFSKMVKNPITENDSLTNSKISLAQLLSKDKKDFSHNIEGFFGCIRLNQDKLQRFINSNRSCFWDKIPSISFSDRYKSIKSDRVKILSNNSNQISSENISSSFENYNTDTREKKEIYEIAKNFANAVIVHENKQPLGLILSGKPGIGKTHLSVAILNMVHQHSDNTILYLDEKYIKDYFQCYARNFNIDEILKGIDLIIYDDINTKYGIGSDFFKKAIKYVFTNNKAIMISSNINLKIIHDSLPRYISYNDPISDNFIVINNINIKSYRNPWTNVNCSSLNSDEQLSLLANYDGSFASGIVTCSNQINRLKSYQFYIDKYNKLVSGCKTRCVLEPMKNNHVYDLYLHDIDEYNTFIIQVTNNNEGEQLVHLIEKVHDKGSKIIVLCNDERSFINYVINYINSYGNDGYKQKRIDRLRIIFPRFF